ncbi:MAG: hypothetical protein A2Y10_11185 [Planctomycetes bacterium GWF2_41_51]|nr:MAG: hypothetical protein A2Y10_11185 [Planctomycetes bacterium GWF2_41_51]HBG28387.1 hypothetical protein [Phycisphaerales bacterium]
MPDYVKQGVSVKTDKDELTSSVLQSLPIGIIVFDKELKIQSSNAYANESLDIQIDADATLSGGTNESIWGSWRTTLLEVINSGKSCLFDNVNYRSSGKSALLQITCVPMIDNSDSSITGGIILFENITEKATIQKQFAQNERLAALGKLASKVAHELNNPIDGVLRYINLAKRNISEQGLSKPVEYLENACDGLKRMIGIITELLEFSRTRHSTLEDTSIDRIIDDAVKFYEPRAAAAGIEIQKRYDSTLPKTKGSNLFQVFCNLLKNAIEAMPDGGKIIISCEVGPDIAAIIFRDTGSGFNPLESDSIFEPFFTTKTGSKGTGLGLAICRDIIEKYGGKITAENAPDGGSIFTVYLPVNK